MAHGADDKERSPGTGAAAAALSARGAESAQPCAESRSRRAPPRDVTAATANGVPRRPLRVRGHWPMGGRGAAESRSGAGPREGNGNNGGGNGDEKK